MCRRYIKMILMEECASPKLDEEIAVQHVFTFFDESFGERDLARLSLKKMWLEAEKEFKKNGVIDF